MTGADRDRAAYSLARSYLLGFERYGVTPDLLLGYLNPPDLAERHGSLQTVFRCLVASAQNANMKAAVVGGSIGGIDALAGILDGFDPHKVQERYGHDWEQLLSDIEKKVRPAGKIRKAPRSIWPRFCRSVLSGAEFLSGFEESADFSQWVELFDRDERTRPALPMLLAAEIEGFGFPLACNFLKDIGFSNFCKPDIHVKKIFEGLGLAPAKSKDYQLFKAIIRLAQCNGVTPYAADKLFWLVGSGYLHDNKELGKDGRIPVQRDEFIEEAAKKLNSKRPRRRR